MTSASESSKVRVVGIGASAGGLDAIIEIVEAIPPTTGLAFVIVQHLNPDHESLLVEILSGKASIPVAEIVNEMRVESDRIYVMPAGVELTIEGGVLRLFPRKPGLLNRPIDSFLSSLSSEQGTLAVGIVL